MNTNKNSGFSFIEALVAITIILILVPVLILSLQAIVNYFNQARNTIKADYQFISFYDNLNSIIERVKVPIWDYESSVVLLEDNSMSIAYIDGDKTKKATINWDSDELNIHVDDNSHIFYLPNNNFIVTIDEGTKLIKLNVRLDTYKNHRNFILLIYG